MKRIYRSESVDYPMLWIVFSRNEGGSVRKGIRIKPVENMLFSDRETFRGFSAFGWRVTFYGWRRPGR